MRQSWLQQLRDQGRTIRAAFTRENYIALLENQFRVPVLNLALMQIVDRQNLITSQEPVSWASFVRRGNQLVPRLYLYLIAQDAAQISKTNH